MISAKSTIGLIVCLLCLSLSSSSATAWQTDYSLSEDSKDQADVPKGDVQGPFQFRSEVYPGTIRNYWVYVPANYTKEMKPCLLVVQDGLGRAKDWKLSTVMDNLIHKREMPPTLGLFVDHGVVPAANEKAQPRFNRSFEYDAMGDRYARFLVDEMLPELRKSYSFSDDPNDHAIAGASSGGICAFNVAWERPDQFRRVICTIGTFVGLRGGDQFSTLVRKTEAKPIRVFLQDGSEDLDIYAGGWWTANQGMLAALKWAGYDVKHVWGDGGHNGKHGASIMPDALRWLWRHHPAPVVVKDSAAVGRRLQVLLPGENWTVDPKLDKCQYITADDSGSVKSESAEKASQLEVRSGIHLAWDSEKNQIQLASESTTLQFELAGVNGLAVSPDHSWVWAGQRDSSFITSYLLSENNLKHAQQYGDLHVRHGQANCSAGAMLTDTEGNLLVATDLGIQVLDPLGRVNFIIRNPDSGLVTDMCWGGDERNTLYVLADGQVFRRKLAVKGTDTLAPPSKPPKPGL